MDRGRKRLKDAVEAERLKLKNKRKLTINQKMLCRKRTKP
eukprot:UN27233